MIVLSIVIFFIGWGRASDSSDKLSEIIGLDGENYIYLYKKDCRYCDNIQNDISEFASEETVYMVDVDKLKGVQSYDWSNHSKLNDVVIGEKNGDKLSFYNSHQKEDIERLYLPFDYKIILAEEEDFYGRSAGKIYAVSTHPILHSDDFEEGNIVLPGVPLLLKVRNHKVVGYYFDDKEIIEFLNTDTKPIDRYWNVE